MQSLIGHFKDIEMVIKERNTDIKQFHHHSTLLCLYMGHRSRGVGGGGVSIYVRDTFKSNKIFLFNCNDKAVEDIWATAQNSMYPSFHIGTIHKQPHALAETFN